MASAKAVDCSTNYCIFWSFRPSYLSLINTSHLFNDPHNIPTYEGITIPPTALYPEHSASPCKTVKLSRRQPTYADDLTAFMRSAAHLPAFQTLEPW